MRATLLALVFLLVLAGCEEAERPPLSELRAGAPVMQIVVLADGTVRVDDRLATLEILDTRFAELAEAYGVVWYYRENPGDDPSMVAADVTRKLVDHLLPIVVSSERDFSDITGGAGGRGPAGVKGAVEPIG